MANIGSISVMVKVPMHVKVILHVAPYIQWIPDGIKIKLCSYCINKVFVEANIK